MSTDPIDEDPALLALKAAISTLDPPPSRVDVAVIARRSTARTQHRRSVVRRSLAAVAVAASAAGVVVGVMHLGGVTATAESSASSAAPAAPPSARPSAAGAAPETSPSGACPAVAFSIVVPAEGQGADSPRAALDAWLTRRSNSVPKAPQPGWKQQSIAWEPGDVTFTMGRSHVETAEIPGRGWFVTGGAPC